VREHGGSVQRTTFAVNRLGRRVIFASDFVEHECKKYGKHNADLQINGIAHFMLFSADIETECPPNKACSRKRSNRDNDDDKDGLGVAHR
jgi:hypothetical protein